MVLWVHIVSSARKTYIKSGDQRVLMNLWLTRNLFASGCCLQGVTKELS